MLAGLRPNAWLLASAAPGRPRHARPAQLPFARNSASAGLWRIAARSASGWVSRARPPVVARPALATSRAVTALALFRRRLRSAHRQSWPLHSAARPCRGAPYPPRHGRPSARATPAGRLSPAADGARAAPAPATPAAGGKVRGGPYWHRENHPCVTFACCSVGFSVRTLLVSQATPLLRSRVARFGVHGFRYAAALRRHVPHPPTQPSRPKGSGCPAFNVVPVAPVCSFRVPCLRLAASRAGPWSAGRGGRA